MPVLACHGFCHPIEWLVTVQVMQLLVMLHITQPCVMCLQQVMRDPVIAADGHTYERGAIMHWMNANSISPVTHQALPNKHLTPNAQAKSALNRAKQSERAH